MKSDSQSINANGTKVPQIGLGTWPMKGAECKDAIAAALEFGYRHIDTAQMYDNEGDVGAAIAASDIDREQIFLTTKIWPDNFRAADFADAVDRSLDRLGMEYVDLLLLHWPSPEIPLAETIEALNRAHQAGQARAIGVSNFTVRLIEEAVLLSGAKLALNQVEYHPFLTQAPVLQVCRRHGLAVAAYCPLARGRGAQDPVISGIARRMGRSAEQVALRWLVQQGVIAVPKSATRSRIAENFDVFSFSLTEADMARISGCAEPAGRIVSMAPVAPDWDT
jgi:2,5-diketo-D-gluconate reductase B